MSQSILFLDKVLTKPLKDKDLRGVEVFNLYFLNDLIELGHEVTLVIDPSWQKVVEKEVDQRDNLTTLTTAKVGGKLLGSLAPLWQIRRQKFNHLFLANVGDGILIQYYLILFFKMVKSTTLLAHKVPGKLFTSCLKKETRVVSVNQTIADAFAGKDFAVNEVHYGILNTDQYYPADSRSSRRFRFGMLGDLDSEWKGSDVAIEAFLKLPQGILDECELHLAAFRNNAPEEDAHPNIVLYDWVERSELGDYLRSLDIMLSLSREIAGNMMETFCQSMVQGMLCGLPQITTDLQIFTEKIDQGGGISTTGSAEEITQAMIKLYEDESLRVAAGKAAEKTASDRYCWDSETFVKRYL